MTRRVGLTRKREDKLKEGDIKSSEWEIRNKVGVLGKTI